MDEADEAQEKAKNAIAQANEDIALAKADLEKVSYQCKVNRQWTTYDIFSFIKLDWWSHGWSSTQSQWNCHQSRYTVRRIE